MKQFLSNIFGTISAVSLLFRTLAEGLNAVLVDLFTDLANETVDDQAPVVKKPTAKKAV